MIFLGVKVKFFECCRTTSTRTVMGRDLRSTSRLQVSFYRVSSKQVMQCQIDASEQIEYCSTLNSMFSSHHTSVKCSTHLCEEIQVVVGKNRVSSSTRINSGKLITGKQSRHCRISRRIDQGRNNTAPPCQ
jgi:hypothetical protein